MAAVEAADLAEAVEVAAEAEAVEAEVVMAEEAAVAVKCEESTGIREPLLQLVVAAPIEAELMQ